MIMEFSQHHSFISASSEEALEGRDKRRPQKMRNSTAEEADQGVCVCVRKKTLPKHWESPIITLAALSAALLLWPKTLGKAHSS